MKNEVRLPSGRVIGHGYPCFIVAEIGNNHQGDVALAREMVHRAAQAGVSAVKFQKRCTKALLTAEGMTAPYTGANSFGPTYGEHRDALELSIEDMADLKALAEELDLVFFTSAWDSVSLAQMADLDVEVIKFSSADLVCLPLMRQAAAMNRPIILSTGMSPLTEVDLALTEIFKHHDDVILLHCNSSYPCPEERIGLPVIEQLRRTYNLPVGYSGHEQGIGPSVASVALGACVVERHFTMDKDLPGTDHQASLDPDQLDQMVQMIREVERAMQVKTKRVFPSEVAMAKKLRKSVVFSRDLPAGYVLTEADMDVKCPGTGISPLYWDELVGSVLRENVYHEQQVDWSQVTPGGRHTKYNGIGTTAGGRVAPRGSR